jgi:hypothetical protein
MKLPLRLAMRIEGDKWNAYIARDGTMDGAIWVGSIAFKFGENEKRREQFLALMSECLAEMIEEMASAPPERRRAPEQERTSE